MLLALGILVEEYCADRYSGIRLSLGKGSPHYMQAAQKLHCVQHIVLLQRENSSSPYSSKTFHKLSALFLTAACSVSPV